MSKDALSLMDQLRSGNLNFFELERLADELLQPVTLTGCEVCYSLATNQLSGFCTVTANNSGDIITGLGVAIFESDGSPMICLQYSNALKDREIMTSVGTNLYTVSMGNSVLCIVYGYTQNSGFFFIKQILPVGFC